MRKRILPFLLALLITLCLPVTGSAVTNDDTYTKINEYLQRSVETLNIPGMSVIIVDKDDVLFSGTYGNCDSIETPFIIGSMSKSFTAACIMQLVEEGKINLDNNISVYLPDATDGNKITVRQLLNHTSGLGEYQCLSNYSITDTYGTHQYANVNYNLLGKIIENVSGMSYDEYVTENIFTPLGMVHSAASLEDAKEDDLIDGYRNFFGFTVAGEPDYPNGNSWSQVPAGYISSSASDMGKYLQMYLNGGESVLNADSINSMFYDNADIPYINVKYGMGWELSEDYDEPILSHAGLVENYMSYMFILPNSGIGVAMFVNTNDYLVTDTIMNSVSGSTVLMLMGNDPIEISDTAYWASHLLYDGIYLALFLVALLPLLLLKRYKKKLPTRKARKTVLSICILHIVFPTVLILFLQIFILTPLWVVRYYVPDLFLVLAISAALLYVGGMIKAILYCKARVRV